VKDTFLINDVSFGPVQLYRRESTRHASKLILIRYFGPVRKNLIYFHPI